MSVWDSLWISLDGNIYIDYHDSCKVQKLVYCYDNNCHTVFH